MPYRVYSIVLISFLFSFLLPFLAQSSRSGPLTRVLSAGLASAQFLGLSRGDKHLRLSRKLHDVRHYMAHDAPTHLHFPRTFFAAKHTPNKCVLGHGFSFLSQFTWEGCRFLCSCCSLSYPASSGMGLDRRPLHAVPAPPAVITPPSSVSLL